MKIISVVPLNKRFAWETYCFLNNMRENDVSKDTIILVFNEHFNLKKGIPELWNKIQIDFPEVEFFFHDDKENFSRLTKLFGYIPLIRPKLLGEYWKLHPEMEQETVFYIDTDVLFTKKMDFTPFLQDDVIYMSDAKTYTNVIYFDSKGELTTEGGPKFVLPHLYEEFKKRDFVEEMAHIGGVTRKILEENNNSSGAAQYLLKNINKEFWDDVLNTSITLKIHIDNLNMNWFQGATSQEKSNNGWQAWCTDIWALNWQLLRRGRKISTPKEFDFLWTTDDINRLTEVSLYHNAGINSSEKLKRKVDKEMVDCPVFYKGKQEYVTDVLTPFDDDYELEQVMTHPISSKFCVAWYCEQLVKTKSNFNL